MTIEETLLEAQQAGVGLAVTRDLKLSAKPASLITPELRAGIKEHRDTIICEIMWQEYVAAIGVSTDDLPPASPHLAEAYGDPPAFAEALVEYDLVRRYWDLIKQEAEDPHATAIFTRDGIFDGH